jgi:hypothetical protein
MREQIEDDVQHEQFDKKKKYYTSFCQNLRDGISYYRKLAVEFNTGREEFIDLLDHVEIELDEINYQYSIIDIPAQTVTEISL